MRTELFAVPKTKPDVLYIGLNDRDARWHDLYELHISTGKSHLLRKNTEQIAGWDFDNDGTLRLVERTSAVGDTEVLRVTADGFKQIYGCTVLESCGVGGFDKSNRQVYLITNKGALDLTELELMDPTTGVTSKVESDPESRVDLHNVATSEVDYRILFTEYQDDVPRLYFRDKAFEQGYRWLKGQLPGKEIAFGSHSRDESIWILTAYSDTDPGATYIWNRKANTLALQYLIREQLPRASLSERQPYQFKSSDGLLIRGYSPTLRQGSARPDRRCRSWSGCMVPGARRRQQWLRHRVPWSSTAAMRCCSRTSAAPPVTASVFSTPATASGDARCRMI